METILNEINLAVQKGNAKGNVELINKAISEKIDVNIILNAMLDAMSIIGEKFKKNEIFVPNVLISARALNAGLDIVKPLIEKSANRGKVVHVIIGTIKGDQHDIGKNLVRMMLVGSGFEVHDIGVDVSAEKFVEAAIKFDAKVICISALLTTTMDNMKDVVDLLIKKGLKDKISVMVGGAPLTAEFAKKIGADYYTSNAASAAEVAKQVFLNS